jgi:hypothetical protein
VAQATILKRRLYADFVEFKYQGFEKCILTFYVSVSEVRGMHGAVLACQGRAL